MIGSPTMGFMLLNCARPPTDDLRIRQALAKATDQVAIQKVFGDGSVQVDRRPLPSRLAVLQPDRLPGPRPRRGPSLVAEYAAQHGAPSIQISSTPDPRTIQLVQVVQQMWQQAGVHVSITVVQQADVIIDLLTGEFQAVPSAQFGAVDPDLNYPWLSSTTVQPIGTVGLNFARNDDPVIEAALVSARSTLDQATRVDALPDGRRTSGRRPSLRLDRPGHLPLRRRRPGAGDPHADPARRTGGLRVQRGGVLPRPPVAGVPYLSPRRDDAVGHPTYFYAV